LTWEDLTVEEYQYMIDVNDVLPWKTREEYDEQSFGCGLKEGGLLETCGVNRFNFLH
jgi:hypothetical protein